ncbi:phosphofructokinase [Petrotoga mobilis SJ95]|uniref:Pyrophosphate--fructose 6-phosphate 1-phosphotransferase n=1 Tax=Petrotoga mobilis (strain DSM 10674 / SJ95) TaxID=403833 RepID=A9BIW9_PETMO|nr:MULTISPECIES: 6-phosphofructokinase [Petrotoga]ABX32457.1 phosphofructokinase [Petrotoga mobilis SJ95]MBL5981512.1 6-phosphofructokinase [Petrotoga sp. 8T1HF07.NaAc.6.1]PNR93835.1 6-phosphofructokinase [Petrotoga sp. HWHPT.55.6.3]RPD36090.1 6-phosphofructokinase [Petrotoga sp. HWH.PT.55.6.1]
MNKKNILYAQSGGVTSVINASAYGLISKALKDPQIDKIYVGINGITGVLEGKLFDLTKESFDKINNLKTTPASAFGTCRHRLKEGDEEGFQKLFKTFEDYNISYFFYNGGNDSMDTAHKIDEYSKKIGYDLKVIGIPKTIDNDLYGTDHSPGYGSAAKYLAISMLEASIDTRSMAKDSTKIFIMETMGRHAGWLTAATSLAKLNRDFGPHIILLPERIFEEDHFIDKVQKEVSKNGYCTIAVSEGIRYKSGAFVSDMGYTDSFGNRQLGDVGRVVANIILTRLGLKVHVSIPDYLQRSAGHIVSKTDQTEAVMVGEKALEYALDGISGFMVTINRLSNNPYKIEFGKVPLFEVANNTKYLPEEYISVDGYGVNENFIEYAKPLIQGESYPLYENGIPKYVSFPIEER